MKTTLAALVGAISVMATVPAVAGASSSATTGSAALAAGLFGQIVPES